MRFIASFILLTSLLSFSCLAETQLEIAEAFNVRAVNGKLYSKGLFSQTRKLKLKPGLNLIALEYEEVFENDDGENFDIIKSDTFILKVYLKRNQDYRQRYTRPHNASAARRYRLNPVFEIIEFDRKNNRQLNIKFEMQPLAAAGGSDSFLISKTRAGKKSTLDLSHPNRNKSKHSNKEVIPEKSLMQTDAKSNAVRMLEYWWKQATPEEREAFLRSHQN